MKKIDELREVFLTRPKGAESYWDSQTLEQYDRTLGRRIGWKWNALLRDLAMRVPLAELPRRWIDWGCGTAIASRALGVATPLEAVYLVDRSPLAIDYSRARLATELPQVTLLNKPPENPYGILVSHLVNELTDEGMAALRGAIAGASWVLWAEPGTPGHSASLIAFRDEALALWDPIAPCPHSGSCPLKGLSPMSPLGWCHQFVGLPADAAQDAEWAHAARELKLDPRSVSVSYLVLRRKGGAPPRPTGPRALGRPRWLPRRAKIILCQPDGNVSDATFTKRRDPEAYRRLRKHRAELGNAEEPG